MFCLFKYPKGSAPIKNKLLVEKLWGRVNIKYGFRQQSGSTSAIISRKDLQFELECRHYHMKHLLTTLERFTDWVKEANAFDARNAAYGMVTQLADILNRVKNNTAATDPCCQIKYEQIITRPHHSVGSFYVDLCERLSTEITDAELRCMFPATHGKSTQWNCTLDSGNEFQPKIGELMGAIQHDIHSLPLNNYHTSLRIKIGFIGYTSSGKTTLMCRLLGIVRSGRDQFLPVHTTKSTYYPLQYDRNSPLISPDDQRIATAVKFVDIQGCDRGSNIFSGAFEAGNYLDEIYKADCDIYVVVFNEELDNDQHQWIRFIEKIMQRQCVLVRSKIDEPFLAKFLEDFDVCYGMSSPEERIRQSKAIIDSLRRDLTVEGRHIYLTAASYYPNNGDAARLLQDQGDQPFDFQLLLNELSRMAPLTRKFRIGSLAARAVARVINSCFRRGYVLNVMKYKIAGGIAAMIPFVDLLPRYLAKDSVREAFGITEDFLQDLRQRQLSIVSTHLHTSVFQKYVNILIAPIEFLANNGGTTGHVVAGIATVSGSIVDDIARAATPALSTLSGGARLAIGVATVGIGVALSAGVCAWSAVNTGKHIFSFTNQLCDDLIVVSIPLIASMIQE